jgi:hypothetical protein
MARRFGPTRAAGVAIIEQESGGAIVPGALGTTAYTGILKKGPKKAFRASTKSDYLFKAGGLIPASLLPDAALSYYRASNGAGEVWYNRVTDGSEKKSSLSLYNQVNSGALVATFEAGNGGRWAGKKFRIVDEYASLTEITLTLSNAPANLKKDELVGALVKLKAVPGKSFPIESNTDAGVLTFAADINLLDEIAESSDPANTLTEIVLSNDGESLGVLVKPGLLQPNSEFGLEFYLIEGNVAELKKNFTDLSIDPSKPNYFVDAINAESDSDFLIKAIDLNMGGSLVAGQRPANYANEIVSLTQTVLTTKIHYPVFSSVNNAKMKLSSVSLGSEIIKDKLTLTNTVAGARAEEILTFGGQPADNATLEIAGVVYTWKTVVATPATQIEIGADAEGSIDNLVAFVLANSPLTFAEKDSATVAHIHARTAGLAGNAYTLVSSDANVVAGAGVLSGGVDQTWDMVSEKMPFTGTTVVTSGIAVAALNDFGYGFTLEDNTLNSAVTWSVNDTITVYVEPLELNALEGGRVYPNKDNSRKSYLIDSNNANTITVKPGSDLTVDTAIGETFRAQYIQELSGGYDGIADIADLDYENAYDVGTSKLRSLRGKNLGLVKLATPGITSSAVQKAGVAFAGSQNWQYRYEVPANITDEVACEEFINDTLGRNDFAVVSWPSFIRVSKDGGGLKLISATGAIHGVEARIARDFDGYHKAAAGTDAILSQALALPAGFDNREPLDQEFLNPQGINILLEKSGNFILWGDRTVGLDPAFKFKHHREYLSHVENIFIENFDFIIFALNSEESGTQEILKAAFFQFFSGELAKGALVGKDVQEATLLKIDSENNTTSTRADGDLFADMALAIVDTVERFIIRIGKQGVTEGAV